ncbi:MAG: 2-phosphosulfolactate phosphatase [Actinomycetota bacterium]
MGEAAFARRWELDGVRGAVVVVDVIRAFTTAAYALDAGASEIWLVAGVDEAVELGRSLPGAVVMGEDRGHRPPGFDLPNSPVMAAEADLAGRPVVQRTSAGTQGAVAARGAELLLAASLVCASATAAVLRGSPFGAPTYVITGAFPDRPDGGADDRLTAELIERARLGLPLEAAETARAVSASDEAQKTLALGSEHVHADDIAYATAVDRFDFAMRVDEVEGQLRLTRFGPPAP